MQFLTDVRATLQPGDSLLLGTDLLKPIPQLLQAYDDPLGVTAAFNKNLLARINHDLGADFNLDQFDHLARFNSKARSVEMHLISKRAQTVTIPGAGFSVRFAEGETIWTESSHKYSKEEICQMATETGFKCEAQWMDREWPFAESLLLAL
jgi:uncharacterized SAM-dependent methyltransferase